MDLTELEGKFPDGEPVDPLMRVMDELGVGERAIRHLKTKQGIGTNEDYQAGKMDAVGGIVIYLADYCNKSGIDLEQAVWRACQSLRLRNWAVENHETGDVREEG